jgi:hypothetical protein
MNEYELAEILCRAREVSKMTSDRPCEERFSALMQDLLKHLPHRQVVELSSVTVERALAILEAEDAAREQRIQ